MTLLSKPLLQFLFIFTVLEVCLANENICQPMDDSDFSWNKLEEMILSGKIRSVEGLLCRLPNSYKEQYSLSHTSRSLQESDSLNPRVLLFDKNDPTKLILSFNGNPDHRGFNNIEIVRRKNELLGQIELVDIEFDSKKTSPGVITYNPQKCLNCHETRIAKNDIRYLFDANPVWEGFYGSGLKFPFNSIDKLSEQNDFLSFQEYAQSHSRYKYLRNLDLKVSNTSDLPDYVSRDRAGELSLRIINNRLTQEMAKLNHKRILNLMINSTNFEQYKYAIYASLRCEYPPEDYIPLELRAWHTNETWIIDELKDVDLSELDFTERKLLIERIDKANKWHSVPMNFLNSQIKRVENSPYVQQSVKFLIDTQVKQEEYSASPFIINRWRYLFEGRLNPVLMREWNIDIDSGFYRFNNNKRTDFDIIAFENLLSSSFPELPRFPPRDGQGFAPEDEESIYQTKLICQDLKKTSQDALTGLKDKLIEEGVIDQLPIEENLLNGPSLVNYACLHCHARENQYFAPNFNFHDPDIIYGLAETICERMSKPLESMGHMPKFIRLEKSQQKIIFDYFNSLEPEFQCHTSDGYEKIPNLE